MNTDYFKHQIINSVGVGLVSARNNINLSTICNIITKHWKNISNEFNNIKLDLHIIMPNHAYGIIIINDPVGNGHARSSNNYTDENIGSGRPEPYRTILLKPNYFYIYNFLC